MDDVVGVIEGDGGGPIIGHTRRRVRVHQQEMYRDVDGATETKLINHISILCDYYILVLESTYKERRNFKNFIMITALRCMCVQWNLQEQRTIYFMRST